MKLAVFADTYDRKNFFLPASFVAALGGAGLEFEVFCRKNNIPGAEVHCYDNDIFRIIAPSRIASLPTTWLSILSEAGFDAAAGIDETGLVMAAQTDLPLVGIFNRPPTAVRAVRPFMKSSGPSPDEVNSAISKCHCILARCTEVAEIIIARGFSRDKTMVWPIPPEFHDYIHIEDRSGIGTFAMDPVSLSYAVMCTSLINDLGRKTTLKIFCNDDHFDFKPCLENSRCTVEYVKVNGYEDFFYGVAGCQVFLSPDVTGEDGRRDYSGIFSILSSLAQVPQVASCHGIFPDIIEEGVTGFLTAERNADIMQDRCLEIIENPQFASEMGQSARAKLEFQFEYSNLAARLEGFLNYTLRRRN